MAEEKKIWNEGKWTIDPRSKDGTIHKSGFPTENQCGDAPIGADVMGGFTHTHIHTHTQN